jgi:tripeptide aminopeptidase
VKILLRDFSEDGMQRRKDLLAAIVEAARCRHQRAEINLAITDQYENMRSHIERIDPRVVSFAHAAAEQLGLPLKNDLVRGGTDGARLSAEGLPTPNLFTGGHDFHSRFEWNTIQNLERSLAFTRGLLAYWCEHGTEDAEV